MNLLILGAAGRLGREVVNAASARGHSVTAFARRPHTADDPTEAPWGHGPNIRAFPGDALDAARVADAVRGHDAVVSTLGQREGEPTLTEGLRNVLAAMRRYDVRRIVAVAGRGVLDDPRGGLIRDRPEFPAFLQAISAVHLAALRELQASGLDWTLVCPPRMVDDDRPVRLAATTALADDGPVGYRGVAEAIVDLVEEGRFRQERVAVAPATSPRP